MKAMIKMNALSMIYAKRNATPIKKKEKKGKKRSGNQKVFCFDNIKEDIWQKRYNTKHPKKKEILRYVASSWRSGRGLEKGLCTRRSGRKEARRWVGGDSSIGNGSGEQEANTIVCLD